MMALRCGTLDVFRHLRLRPDLMVCHHLRLIRIFSSPLSATFLHFFSFSFLIFLLCLPFLLPRLDINEDASNITGSRSFDSQNRAEGHCENDGDWCVCCEVQAAERQLGTIYVIGEHGQRQPSPRYRCSLLKRGDGSET